MRIISQGVASPGRSVPRIYLFTSEKQLPYEVLQSLSTTFDITSREERDDGTVNIPLYYIRDIESIPNNPEQAIVYISIAHDDFENPTPSQNTYGIENTIFRLKVSVTSLTLLRGMFRTDDNAVWNVKGGRPMDSDFQSLQDITVDPPLFSVSFPPESMQTIWESLDEAMLNLSVGTYADASDAHHTGAPYSLRIAQQEALKVLLALTAGDVQKSSELFDDIRRSYDMNEKGEYTARGFRADVSRHFRDLVYHAYAVSFPYSDHMSKEMSVSGGDDESEFDTEFTQLMQASGLDVTLKEIAESDPAYRSDPSDTYGITDPLRHGIPLTMLTITEHLENTKPHILEMCRWDFTRESVISDAVEKYGEGDVAIAIITTIALRVARFFEVSDIATRRFIFLVRILTLNGDPYPWELASFNDSLMKNDTNDFKEMLSVRIPNVEEPHDALYVIPSLLALTGVLDAEEWNLDNLDARLAQVPLGADKSNAGVRSLLACLVDRDENEDGYEGFITPVRRARETYDTEFLASNIAHIIPILADRYALETRGSRGSEEWRRARRAYIDTLVGNASFRLARRLGSGEVEE